MRGVSTFHFWMYRIGYVGVGSTCILLSIIPFDLSANTLPYPDIFYCFTMIFIVRRPEYVSVWAVFFVFFLRDILTQAPLGLFTFLVIMASEVVRANIQAFREYNFWLEWLWVAAIFIVIMVVQQTILALTLSDMPQLMENILPILLTVMAYPAIVGLVQYGFGLQRPQPGELDAWGNRL